MMALSDDKIVNIHGEAHMLALFRIGSKIESLNMREICVVKRSNRNVGHLVLGTGVVAHPSSQFDRGGNGESKKKG